MGEICDSRYPGPSGAALFKSSQTTTLFWILKYRIKFPMCVHAVQQKNKNQQKKNLS